MPKSKEFLKNVPETWKEIKDLPFSIGAGRAVSSDLDDQTKVLNKFFMDTPSGLIYGRLRMGYIAEGPPLHVHGGASAYFLDEAMGVTSWAFDLPSVAAKLNFEYHQVAPLFQELETRSYLSKVTPTHLEIKAELRVLDGDLLVSGFGDFRVLNRSKMEKLLSSVDPENYAIDLDRYSWAPE